MNNLIHTLLFSLMALAIHAQQSPEPQYLSSLFQPTTQENAAYIRTLEASADGTFKATVRSLGGDLRMEGHMTKVSDLYLEHGMFTFYYDNGQVESQGYYEMGIKVGSWKRFTAQGSERPERYYRPESADFLRSIMAGNSPESASAN
ncbi:MAG: hypothetical protein KDC12_06635 [Flavobacteriales bacterium]|nr:hypothetical protein [Flavobacteriales bacterium]